jgi:hypothetical protein
MFKEMTYKLKARFGDAVAGLMELFNSGPNPHKFRRRMYFKDVGEYRHLPSGTSYVMLSNGHRRAKDSQKRAKMKARRKAKAALA